MPQKNRDNSDLRKKLQHIYWIGGGSGAGKSTIARRIADQYNFKLYDTDAMMAAHGERSTPETCPLMYEFKNMDMDERWVNRSPAVMFETFHWFHGGGFNLIIEDLLQMPLDTDIIVEGFRLLPHLVAPLLTTKKQAIWLLPTEDFRELVFNGRGGVSWGFVSKTSSPDKALHNLLERDQMFTKKIKKETDDLNLSSIEVTSSMTEDDLAQVVADNFQLT